MMRAAEHLPCDALACTRARERIYATRAALFAPLRAREIKGGPRARENYGGGEAGTKESLRLFTAVYAASKAAPLVHRGTR